MQSPTFTITNTPSRSTIRIANTDLKLFVYRLAEKNVEVTAGETVFYGVYQDKRYAFITKGWNAEDNDQQAIIGIAILWFAKQKDIPAMHISLHEPSSTAKAFVN